MIELSDVSRSYESPGGRVQALERTSLAVEAGNVAWVSGDSGSGKSTLLAIAGLLIVPDEGTVAIEGRVLSHESDARRTEARQRLIGFVPQSPRLFPDLPADRNVSLAGRSVDLRDARKSLDRVGMAHKADTAVRLLSGGEQQRVSVARALMCAPKVLLADEPTSALDDTNATLLFELLRTIADEGVAVVIASHDQRTSSVATFSLRVEVER